MNVHKLPHGYELHHTKRTLTVCFEDGGAVLAPSLVLQFAESMNSPSEELYQLIHNARIAIAQLQNNHPLLSALDKALKPGAAL